jgi:hypothetical protein
MEITENPIPIRFVVFKDVVSEIDNLIYRYKESLVQLLQEIWLAVGVVLGKSAKHNFKQKT